MINQKKQLLLLWLICIFLIVGIVSACDIRGTVITGYPNLLDISLDSKTDLKKAFLDLTVKYASEDEKELLTWTFQKSIRDMLLFRNTILVPNPQDSQLSLTLLIDQETDEQSKKVYVLTYKVNKDPDQSKRCATMGEVILALDEIVSLVAPSKDFETKWIDIPNQKYSIQATEVSALDFLKKGSLIKERIQKMFDEGSLKRLLLENSIRSFRAESEYEFCTYENPRSIMHPINCVNKMVADMYCKELGARIPTKQEWMIAYQAGSKSKYWWGNDFNGNFAISDVNGGDQWQRYFTGKQVIERGTVPISGSGKRCNPWNLCDMAGNVWEWVEDKRYDGFQIIKGGAWDYTIAHWYTYDFESSADPEAAYHNVGFRCLKDK